MYVGLLDVRIGLIGVACQSDQSRPDRSPDPAEGVEIKDFQGETALVTRGSRAIWNIEPPAQDRLGVTAQAALGNKTYPTGI